MWKQTVLISTLTFTALFGIAQGAGGAQKTNNDSAYQLLLEQSLELATKETMNYIVMCGNSYFGKKQLFGGQIIETKGFGYLPFDNVVILTEADRLNGVEFKGRYVFEGNPSRTMYIGKPWADWTNETVTIVVSTLRKNGQWVIRASEGPFGGSVTFVKGFSCSQLPGAKK